MKLIKKAKTALEPREQSKRKREVVIIFFLLMLVLGLTLAGYRLSGISASLPFINSIFFFGLLYINIIVLGLLVWLIYRNLWKIYSERQRKVLGSRLKTKLVIAFLGFSFVPTLVLFVISSLYINTSFDKWFSIKIQNTLQSSLEITKIYYRNADQSAKHFAEHIAQTLNARFEVGGEEGRWIQQFLDSQRTLLALDSVEFYRDLLSERLISKHPEAPDKPRSYPHFSLDLLKKVFSGEAVQALQHIGSGDLIRCMVPVRRGEGPILGAVAVSFYIPISLVNKVDEIASVLDDYRGTNPLQYPIKGVYTSILVMMTLLILFAAVWIGIFIARELTVPIERLMKGAQAVGAGNLDIVVESPGRDEISILIDAFNKMTKDLQENRAHLTQAKDQLEAVLANVTAGVMAVDRKGLITNFNRSAGELLDVKPESVIGRNVCEVFAGQIEPLAQMILRSLETDENLRGEEPLNCQWNLAIEDVVKTLFATATRLKGNAEWGVVVVIDNMTHLIKGQREVAWREVARRIAHEIKNPLTPIKLSAQRLQRKLGGYVGKDMNLLKECTDTIIKHSDELKDMVNEFSNFARLPEITPMPHDLNTALKEVVSLYQQAHPQINVLFEMEARMPVFEFDRDQVKRVIVNLFDNAVTVLKENPANKPKIIKISTHYNDQLQMAAIKVEDNGPGMKEETLERVFEPYFSTKSGGTGLGLAITKRIINDHNGFIRVSSTPGEGTTFLIELPTAEKQDPLKKMARMDQLPPENLT